MNELDTLQELLGCQFRDRPLLRLALTHSSVAHEQGVKLPDNQRLEFLGDSVLELVLTHELYRRFPHLGEGVLTQLRARLVNRRFLAERARELGLGPFLILGRSEEAAGGRQRTSILANTFEAIVGALYLDAGLEAARAFILRRFESHLVVLPEAPEADNPKGRLQEHLQATSNRPPEYHLIAVAGPDHDRQFECAVCHEGVELGRGRGKSKKEAEAAAAAAALTKLETAHPQDAESQ